MATTNKERNSRCKAIMAKAISFLISTRGSIKKSETYAVKMAGVQDGFSTKTTGFIDADIIADGIIHEMARQQKLLDNLKLNKLLFYVDNVYFALAQRALLGESFEAWVHGPVIPKIYRRFKGHSWKSFSVEAAKSEGPQDADVREAINQVVDQIGHLDGLELERRSHEIPTYIEARAGLAPDEPSNAIIDRDKTHEYFGKLLAD